MKSKAWMPTSVHLDDISMRTDPFGETEGGSDALTTIEWFYDGGRNTL